MGRSVKPNYRTVSQVFLQMVVALRHKQQTWFLLVLALQALKILKFEEEAPAIDV